MKVYGMLEKAQLEVVGTSLLTTDPEGRIAWNSATEKIEVVDNGTEVLFVVTHSVIGTLAAPIAIVAGTGIVFANKNFLNTQYISGSGGNVIISANPQITAGTYLNQRLLLYGGANSVQMDTGNGLLLNGMCILADGQLLEIMWNGTVWAEIHRSN